MLKIAVCDDNKVMCDYIYKSVLNAFKLKQIECDIAQYFKGSLLLEANENDNFDVVFLDIQMPEVDGFDIADEIKRRFPHMHIIFITANSELVFKSFTYQPFYFICKSTDERMAKVIYETVELLIERFKQYAPVVLELPFSVQRSVAMKDILYIESIGHYLTYYLLDGERIKLRNTMEDVVSSMKQFDFIRISRKFLINFCNMKKIDVASHVAIMSDKTKLAIGRNYMSEVSDKYKQYMRMSDFM